MKTNRKKKKLLKSRRGFFKDAALGAGGIALATGGVTSCNDPSSGSETPASVKNTLIKNGTPPTEVDPDNWFAPKEFDVTRKAGLKSNAIKSNDGAVQINNLYALDVDLNTSGASTGQSTDLYAYNGTVPGPTFRVRGDQTLGINFTNSLGGNNGYWAVKQASRIVMGDERLDPNTADWQIDSHLYGPHQQRITNLHTHGLHVSPGVDYPAQNETQNSVHSDNVLLRVIPYEDYQKRVLEGNGPALQDNEQVAEALYNFKLPRPDGTPHYPGTHWYHPHPHGATYDQVASGMAGFLIVEGPVDDYLAETYAENGYAELPLLIQRIFAPPPSVDAEGSPIQGTSRKGNQQKTSIVKPTINGQSVTDDGVQIPSKEVQPNQVLRLRVLNGSVDGQGYIRFMVTKDSDPTNPVGPAQLDPSADLYTSSSCIEGAMPKNASASAKRWCTSEDLTGKVCLNNIAYDGINLFQEDGTYTSMPVEWLTIGVANRADFLLAIPEDASVGDSYSIWAQDMTEAVDSQKVSASARNLRVATFVVSDGTALPKLSKDSSGALSLDWKYKGQTLVAEEMLMPIGVDEITIKSNAEKTSAYLPSSPQTLDGKPFTWGASNNAGKVRARRVLYTGFGHSSVDNSVWGVNTAFTAGDGTVIPTTDPASSNLINAMLIDGKKYGADTQHGQGWDTAQHKMQVGTAEEWSVYNYSLTTIFNGGTTTDPSSYSYGKPAYKVTLGSDNNPPQLKAKAVHHPFHIHQNPFYVRSIQDAEGNELLPLDEQGRPIPRWQDTVYIPHNGGRAIFRSRFWDYTGKYVDHCHLLQHEDWGMMQAIEVVDGKTDTPNYIPLPPEDAVKQNVFPPMSLNQIYQFDLGKVQETISQESLKMLCYDPSDDTYFNQKNLTNLEAKAADTAGYLKVPMPGDDTPFPSWNNDIIDVGLTT